LIYAPYGGNLEKSISSRSHAVLDNYIFLVLDSYHQICGARGLLCQNGIPAAIRKDSVHRVARESNINRCELNIAMAVDLIDKQNVEFAKTTFNPKVSNALEECYNCKNLVW
jgi:hypothetical protein